jgi:hypothetical protein
LTPQKEIAKIDLKGRPAYVISVNIGGILFISTGKFIKMAKVEKEFVNEVEDPASVLVQLKNAGLKADIFTFMQPFCERRPKYKYYMEWDNVAAIPLKGYDYWREKQIPKQTRRALRKGFEKGIEVKEVAFNDDLVKGITDIFNETPLRQDKPFWHYGKNFDQVKADMMRDIDRSEFIGAYYKGELIGFIKLLFGEMYARTVQNISKIAHREKYPSNALISKAVEVCCKKEIPFLIYGEFEYGKTGSTGLIEFKRHNGFEKIEIPRYYIPLTLKGRILLAMGLHHGIKGLIPWKIIRFLLEIRKKWYVKMHGITH